MLSRRLVALAVALLVGGCASSPTMPTSEEKQALAPSGKLRVGFQLNASHATKDPSSGELKGPAIDLGREIARRLGVPFEPVPYQSVVALVDSAQKGECDIYSIGVNPDRVRFLDFVTYSQTELGYLVAKDAPIAALSNVDGPGVRIAVLERGDSDILLAGTLKQATLVRVKTLDESIAAVRSGRADAMAAIKTILFAVSDQIPGSRILEGRIAVQEIAIGVPKGRGTSVGYVRKVVEELKTKGFVRQSIERASVRGLIAAP